ncbi:hypothetical protein CRG98_025572 [Punica granatum]|uniref:Uncharacterized protein n=1 Tax=Punica granatum TaxID=22663 RepID=A0A2I0JCQ5_PUNGR|nr:hypothetical protein CRG98_025572 [Punica granatum]
MHVTESGSVCDKRNEDSINQNSCVQLEDRTISNNNQLSSAEISSIRPGGSRTAASIRDNEVLHTCGLAPQKPEMGSHGSELRRLLEPPPSAEASCFLCVFCPSLDGRWGWWRRRSWPAGVVVFVLFGC